MGILTPATHEIFCAYYPETHELEINFCNINLEADMILKVGEVPEEVGKAYAEDLTPHHFHGAVFKSARCQRHTRGEA